MKRLDYWHSFARSVNMDTLAKDLNYTWDASAQKYLTSSPVPEKWLSLINGRKKCLDFGTGLGRNYDYLSGIFQEVIGYDTSIMLDRLSILRPEVNTNPNWSLLRSLRFDLVYECTVFQHMDLYILESNLKDISVMTPYLYSCSRSYNDDGRDFRNCKGGENVFAFIDSLNLFEVVKCSIPFDIAKSLNDESTVEILWRSIYHDG